MLNLTTEESYSRSQERNMTIEEHDDRYLKPRKYKKNSKLDAVLKNASVDLDNSVIFSLP